MPRRLCFLLLPLLATLAHSPSAVAEIGAAAALFSSGREAFKQGDFETARSKFLESERIEPAVGTELNLALCEERLGHLLAAWELLQLVGDKLAPSDERATIAHEHREQLGHRLPRLTLVAGTYWPADAAVNIGSTRLTRSGLGTAMPVDPGDLELVVTAPGRISNSYHLHLDEGGTATLVVETGARVAPLTSKVAIPPRSQSARPSQRTLGILGIGAGASFLVVGAVAGFQVIGVKGTMNRECDATRACSPEGMAAADRGKVLSVVSTAAFAIGAGLGATGVWFLLGEDSPREPFGKMALGVGASGATLRGTFQ